MITYIIFIGNKISIKWMILCILFIGEKMNKKVLNFIGTITIFLLGFIVHSMYEWFPNIISIIFFPINESIFEHTKMIFTSYMIWIIIKYFLLKKKNTFENNFLFKELFTTFIGIGVFILIYIPVHNNTIDSLMITLLIYFITISISQIINYFINFKKNYKYLNTLSTVVIIIIYAIATYFAYKPPINSFFIDSTNNSYGLNK